MTQEEKARAYDIIIEKANKMHSENCEACKACIEELIPELAESEDERVSKRISQSLHGYLLNSDEIIQADAWLKKQAEHANFLSKIQVGDKVTRNEAGVLVNLSQLDRVAKKNEKQCKQKFEMKTAEESLGIDSDTYNKIVDECLFGEQKPEENKGNIGGFSPNWSEEDEENFCSVYLDVKSARQNTVNSLSGELKEQEQKRMDEVISWLQSLKNRVQSKQEWSEEDEQHIDSLLKRLDALCRNKFERTRFAISEDREWLKSLRPHNRWKPSDEQIEALKEACDEHWEPDGLDPLYTLYQDLKKLKG